MACPDGTYTVLRTPRDTVSFVSDAAKTVTLAWGNGTDQEVEAEPGLNVVPAAAATGCDVAADGSPCVNWSDVTDSSLKTKPGCACDNPNGHSSDWCYTSTDGVWKACRGDTLTAAGVTELRLNGAPPDAERCAPCPTGSTSVPGSVVCTPCPAGQWSDGSGGCAPCRAGERVQAQVYAGSGTLMLERTDGNVRTG